MICRTMYLYYNTKFLSFGGSGSPEKEERKKGRQNCSAIFPIRSSPFCATVYSKAFIPISNRRPTGWNRKIWANPTRPYFYAVNKSQKTTTAQKPLPPPFKSVTFIGTLKRRYISVLHQAKYSPLRRNGGFSVHWSCWLLLALPLLHISGGLRFGFASPTSDH